MSDPSPPPKPKPGSLRDRIAAFENKGPASPSPAPAPAPRPKPGGLQWKPKQLSPPASPSSGDHVQSSERKVSGIGGMSASDAKESITKGQSLKERMAALQGKGGFGGPAAASSPPPKPLEKPKWKPPPVVAHADEHEVDVVKEKSEGPQTGPLHAHTLDENIPKTEDHEHTDPAPVDAEAESQEQDAEEEERQRRAAIAARMARLGGARVGMAPPIFGVKPPIKKKEVTSDDTDKEDTKSLQDKEVPHVAESLSSDKASTIEPATSSDYFETNKSSSPPVLSPSSTASAEAPLSSSAHSSMSMPVPAGPRRAAPPRKKAVKSPSPVPTAEPIQLVTDGEKSALSEEVSHAIEAPAVPSEASEAVVAGNEETVGEIQKGIAGITISEEFVPSKEVVYEEVEHEEVSDQPVEPLKKLPDLPPVHAESLTAEHPAEESSHTTESAEPEQAETSEVKVEDEDEEEEKARRKRVAEKLAQMGAFNPLAGLPVRQDSSSSALEPEVEESQAAVSSPPLRRDSAISASHESETEEMSHQHDTQEADHPMVPAIPSVEHEENAVSEPPAIHIHADDGADEPAEEADDIREEHEVYDDSTEEHEHLHSSETLGDGLDGEVEGRPLHHASTEDDEDVRMDQPVQAASDSIGDEIEGEKYEAEEEQEREEDYDDDNKEEVRNEEYTDAMDDEEQEHEEHSGRMDVSASADTSHGRSLIGTPSPPLTPRPISIDKQILLPRKAPQLAEEEPPEPPARRALPSQPHRFITRVAESDQYSEDEDLHLRATPLARPPVISPDAPDIDTTDSPSVHEKAHEEEVLDEEEGDPIDPSIRISPSKPTFVQPVQPAQSVSEPENEERHAPRQTIAERMARLGGIRLGAPMPIGRPPPPPPREDSESANAQEEGDAQEEPTDEDDEHARKERIAAKLAGMGGMRFGMLPPTLGSVGKPPLRVRQEDSEEEEAISPAPLPVPAPKRTSMPSRPLPPIVAPEMDSEYESLGTSDEGVKVEVEESEAEVVSYEDANEEPEDVPPPVPTRTARHTATIAVPKSIEVLPMPPRHGSVSSAPGRPPVPSVPASILSRQSTLPQKPQGNSPESRRSSTDYTHHGSQSEPSRHHQSEYVMVEKIGSTQAEQGFHPPRLVPGPPARSAPPPPPPPPPSAVEPADNLASSTPWELPSIPDSTLDLSLEPGSDLGASVWSEDSNAEILGPFPPPRAAPQSRPSSQAPQAYASRVAPAAPASAKPLPEVQLTADELMTVWGHVGVQICEVATTLHENSKKTLVGDGSYGGFVRAVLSEVPNARIPPAGADAEYGYLIYAQTASAVQRRLSEIMPGDVVTLIDAKLKGHKGLQSYSQTVGVGEPLVGVIGEVETKKSKIKVFQANQHVGQQTVESVSYRLEDLKSGTVKVFRVLEA